jgi:hypothetical protein
MTGDQGQDIVSARQRFVRHRTIAQAQNEKAARGPLFS